jgi:hypothetical protein
MGIEPTTPELPVGQSGWQSRVWKGVNYSSKAQEGDFQAQIRDLDATFCHPVVLMATISA